MRLEADVVRVVVGIPARMGSSRFPGKPLCDIQGMSMVEHCYKRSTMTHLVDQVFVAACDEEVETEVRGFGGHVIMTDPAIARPSLRVAEAARTLNLNDDDIVIVVQGDEPLVHPDMIESAVQPLLCEGDVLVSNLCAGIDETDWLDPGEIKVVCDLSMNALYMSRAPIPSIAHEEVRDKWWKQVCVMPFRWHFMQHFNDGLSPTPLEKQESIEMLRAIQHGYKVRMVPSMYASKSVDSDADRRVASEMMASDPLFELYR